VKCAKGGGLRRAVGIGLGEIFFEEGLGEFVAFVGEGDGFGFGFGVADEAFFVEAVEGVPVHAFPGSDAGGVPEGGEVEEGEDHIVDFVLIVFHEFSPDIKLAADGRR
jgi:hypothetical protein